MTTRTVVPPGSELIELDAANRWRSQLGTTAADDAVRVPASVTLKTPANMTNAISTRNDRKKFTVP
jgi:hypothetical protein